MKIQILLFGLLAVIMTNCSQDDFLENNNNEKITVLIGGNAFNVSKTNSVSGFRLYYRFVNPFSHSRNAASETGKFHSVLVNGKTIQIPIPETDNNSSAMQCWLVREGEQGYCFSNSNSVEIDRNSSNRGPVWYAEGKITAENDAITLEFHSALSKICIWTTEADFTDAVRAGLNIYELTSKLVVQEGEPIFSTTDLGEVREVDDSIYRVLFESDVLTTEKGVLGADLVMEGDNFYNSIHCGYLPLEQGKQTVYAGRFLTADVTVNIAVSPSFDGEYNLE